MLLPDEISPYVPNLNSPIWRQRIRSEDMPGTKIVLHFARVSRRKSPNHVIKSERIVELHEPKRKCL